MKTKEQQIIEKQDEYIVIADKILGEWQSSYAPLTELRREIYALKAQLEEQELCPECGCNKITRRDYLNKRTNTWELSDQYVCNNCAYGWWVEQ